MTKRRLLTGFIAVSTFLLFTHSLEAKKIGPDASDRAMLRPKTVLHMWVMPNSPRPVKDLEEMLAPFEKANPTIHVEVTSLDWGSAWTKINAAAISKDAPDIIQLGTTWVGVFSAMDVLEDMGPRVSELGGSNVFLPAAWATSGVIGSKKVTAIPWFVDARALYYRTDVFEKCGLTAKDLDTWEGFLKALQVIKKANLTINNVHIDPLGIPGKNDWNVLHNLAPWIWSAGGDMLSKNAKKVAFTSKEALAGSKFFIGIAAKNGYVPRNCLELNTAQVAAKFNEGAYAMYFDTPAQVKNLSLPFEKGGAGGSIAAKNYGVALYPQGPAGRFTFFGGSNLSIFKSSKQREAAWKVVRYLSEPRSQLAYSKLTGFLPSLKTCFADPYFTKDPKRGIFVEAVKYGRTYPCVSAWGPIEPIMMRHIGIIWDHAAGVYGDYTPAVVDKELKQAEKEVNIVLAESAQ